MSRTILHIDMDAFYAAVEQLDNPDYSGKPVIVGADPRQGKGRGVVATASYEARKYGIHSAMPISQAYRRCPHGIYVRGRHGRYSEVSGQLMDILSYFSPVIEKVSIDEAFMDITASLNYFDGARAIADRIKEQVKSQLHLTASIGIASNKFLAKIASDLQKPDGLVVVKIGEEKRFLADLPIAKMWGVGEKTALRLSKMAINTIGQISEMSEITLRKTFGKWGGSLWNLSRGIDDRPVTTHGRQKSISQERTFDEDTDNEELIEFTLSQLSEHLSRLMKKSRLKGRSVTLKLRLADFSTFNRSRTLLDFIDSGQVIKGIAVELYRNFNKGGKKVRLLGIGVSQLSSVAGEQLALFEQEEPLNEKLTSLLNSLKDRFGEDVVSRASLLKSNKPQK